MRHATLLLGGGCRKHGSPPEHREASWRGGGALPLVTISLHRKLERSRVHKSLRREPFTLPPKMYSSPSSSTHAAPARAQGPVPSTLAWCHLQDGRYNCVTPFPTRSKNRFVMASLISTPRMIGITAYWVPRSEFGATRLTGDGVNWLLHVPNFVSKYIWNGLSKREALRDGLHFFKLDPGQCHAGEGRRTKAGQKTCGATQYPHGDLNPHPVSNDR